MMRSILFSALLLSGVLSGCLGSNKDTTDGAGTGVIKALFAGPALWEDPQNTPHPKWNWPTLANPPVGANVPKWWRPIESTELPGHISGLEPVAQLGPDQEVNAGAGIAIFGSLVVIPSDGYNGAETGYIADISDPTHPKLVGTMETTGRGAAIIAYPTGRLVTAVSTTAGFDLVDITDPTQPTLLVGVEPSEGGHKLGVVPGTPILYNAGSSGGGADFDPAGLLGPGPCNVDISLCTGYTSIYNLTDPESPVLVQEFQNGLACHHIFFWNAPDGSKQRAICAGIQYTQVWDIADPEKPRVIVSLPVHSGVADTPSAQLSIAMFSHTAGINIGGNILYVGDEMMGGGLPPGCIFGTDTPVGEVGTPIGATWFYDISDETNPRLMGYFAPPRDATHSVSRSCTTHHGRVVPDAEGRDLLAMSYYNDGMILVDFTPFMGEGGLAVLPREVAEFNAGSDTWETWYAGGYLFTGDLARGLDVIGFT